MEDYFQKLLSLRNKQEEKGNSPYSASAFFQILREEFNKALRGNPPHEIYGNWTEHLALCKSLSPFYSKLQDKDPAHIIPEKSLFVSQWPDIIPFLRRHHLEFLWFLEKERFLLERSSHIKISAGEKKFKERSTAALQKNNRLKAFHLLKEALAHFPEDFTMYTDMGFLILNDKHDTGKAVTYFKTACKMFFQKKSHIYCFLQLLVNLIYQIENNFLKAYAVTEELVENFRGLSEVNYQHGINALNIGKKEECFSNLGIAFNKNINYTLKAYEEVDTNKYSDTLSRIFKNLVEKKENEFHSLNQDIEAITEEVKNLEIENWNPDIVTSLKSDMNIIKQLGNSKVYVNIISAEYFIHKTPGLLISEITKTLKKEANRALEKNRKIINKRENELEEKLLDGKRYNMIGLGILGFVTTILCVFLSYQKGILFGVSFSLVFASVLLIAIGVNVLQMRRLKIITENEIKRIKMEYEKITSFYKAKLKEFKTQLKKVGKT